MKKPRKKHKNQLYFRELMENGVKSELAKELARY